MVYVHDFFQRFIAQFQVARIFRRRKKVEKSKFPTLNPHYKITTLDKILKKLNFTYNSNPNKCAKFEQNRRSRNMKTRVSRELELMVYKNKRPVVHCL